jgi:splicing factor 3A subunit 2
MTLSYHDITLLQGNYLAHTQGKKHQENLGKRAAKEAAERSAALPQPLSFGSVPTRKAIKIGRPGYTIVKQRDPVSGQRSLLFVVQYPEIEEGMQPRHRFMSAYEQRKEAPDRSVQYLLFAAAPYETIAIKIPATEIDRDPAKFYTHWSTDTKEFTLQLFFKAQ